MSSRLASPRKHDPRRRFCAQTEFEILVMLSLQRRLSNKSLAKRIGMERSTFLAYKGRLGERTSDAVQQIAAEVAESVFADIARLVAVRSASVEPPTSEPRKPPARGVAAVGAQR